MKEFEEKHEIVFRIEGREYPIGCSAEDKEKYKIAARKVSETLNIFKSRFPDKDIKDKLIMTAIQLALEACEQPVQQNEVLFVDELRNLNDDVSDFVRDRIRKK